MNSSTGHSRSPDANESHLLPPRLEEHRWTGKAQTQSLCRISLRGAHLISQDIHLQQAWAGVAGGQKGIRELTSASAAHTAFRPSLVSKWKEREQVERQAWD